MLGGNTHTNASKFTMTKKKLHEFNYSKIMANFEAISPWQFYETKNSFFLKCAQIGYCFCFSRVLLFNLPSKHNFMAHRNYLIFRQMAVLMQCYGLRLLAWKIKLKFYSGTEPDLNVPSAIVKYKKKPTLVHIRKKQVKII